MSRIDYMSTQYASKNSGHKRDSKSEDKDNNATGTAGAHVGDVTPHL